MFSNLSNLNRYQSYLKTRAGVELWPHAFWPRYAMETSGQLCVTATLLTLFIVQETGPQSRYERNGWVKIRLLLLGIEIRLFNRSARSLVVCRKRCKQLLEICSRNQGLIKISRYITERIVHKLALTIPLNEVWLVHGTVTIWRQRFIYIRICGPSSLWTRTVLEDKAALREYSSWLLWESFDILK